MNPLISQFEKFLDSPRRNSGGPRGEDEYSSFLRELSATGRLKAYSEAEWIQMGKEFGLTDDQIAQLVEQAAGWIEDTTEGGTKPPEPAAWA
jgi:hypothetical protein